MIYKKPGHSALPCGPTYGTPLCIRCSQRAEVTGRKEESPKSGVETNLRPHLRGHWAFIWSTSMMSPLQLMDGCVYDKCPMVHRVPDANTSAGPQHRCPPSHLAHPCPFQEKQTHSYQNQFPNHTCGWTIPRLLTTPEQCQAEGKAIRSLSLDL